MPLCQDLQGVCLRRLGTSGSGSQGLSPCRLHANEFPSLRPWKAPMLHANAPLPPHSLLKAGKNLPGNVKILLNLKDDQQVEGQGGQPMRLQSSPSGRHPANEVGTAQGHANGMHGRGSMLRWNGSRSRVCLCAACISGCRCLYGAIQPSHLMQGIGAGTSPTDPPQSGSLKAGFGSMLDTSSGGWGQHAGGTSSHLPPPAGGHSGDEGDDDQR